MTSLDTQLQRQRMASGQSAVEVALVLPALVVLLFGIIISGFVFYAFIQVSNAAREGARAGSACRLTSNVTAYCDDAAKQAVCDSTTGNSSLGYLAPPPSAHCQFSSFNVTRDVVVFSSGSLSAPNPGDQLTVQVAYSYTVPVLSSFVPMFPRPIVIRRSVMMEMQ